MRGPSASLLQHVISHTTAVRRCSTRLNATGNLPGGGRPDKREKVRVGLQELESPRGSRPGLSCGKRYPYFDVITCV